MSSRILVKTDEVKTVSDGGLYIPDFAQQKTTRGEVVKLGTGRPDKRPFTVAVGDVVTFPPFAGTEFNVHGHEGRFLIMHEDDVQLIES